MVPEGAERVQVKVVAIAGECARDRMSDHLGETSWCSDFSTLLRRYVGEKALRSLSNTRLASALRI